jgi:hypothetical protein
MGTITSANSSFALVVPSVFGTIPQLLQGYAADDAFTQEAFDLAETRMGVDGVLSAGYTPSPKRITVMLQPDSIALNVFLTWALAITAAKEQFAATGNILYPSISLGFKLGTVFFKNSQGLPSAKKVIDPFPAVLEYQDLTSFPI